MPELPEVETVRRQLEPKLRGKMVLKVIVRNSNLRWPIPDNIAELLVGKSFKQVQRRGKYLLLGVDSGSLIVHFGMTGSLQLVPRNSCFKTHDHLVIVLANNQSLRFNDPRRFGCVLWTDDDPKAHFLLAKLGPEPFTKQCSAEYLYSAAKRKKLAVKLFIMDSHVIAGVGNIYANEALFWAGIHPLTAANELPLGKYGQLLRGLRKILQAAIEKNGTTFRDFITSEGKYGGFKSSLAVYGRDGQPCRNCKTKLQKIVLAQRYTVFCPHCQVVWQQQTTLI